MGSKVPPRMPMDCTYYFEFQISDFRLGARKFEIRNPQSEIPRLFADVPIPEHDEFHRCQSFKSYRSARVQLVGGDADLGAEAIFKAVGKTRRGVDHHGTGIHLTQEPARAGDVLGHDR